jgi:hypothetical protein
MGPILSGIEPAPRAADEALTLASVPEAALLGNQDQTERE